MNDISLSFSISDNYAQHLAVVVASVLKNNPESAFVCHVLTKAISEESLRRLRSMEGERCRFEFHVVDRSHFDAFPLPLEHITQEMYYRYLLPTILKQEKRTLYLDVDILVWGDLRPLWETDLSGFLMGAIDDGKGTEGWIRGHKERLGMSPESTYFCSGVLLMDLEGLRAFDFTAKCMEATQRLHAELAWPDQDVINTVLENRIKVLSPIYNCMDPHLIGRDEQIVIRHFANFSSKPWCCLWKNRTWPLYLRYLRQTPYRDRVWRFLWAHFKGFFYFRYEKKGYCRILLCGILVWKKRIPKKTSPGAGH